MTAAARKPPTRKPTTATPTAAPLAVVDPRAWEWHGKTFTLAESISAITMLEMLTLENEAVDTPEAAAIMLSVAQECVTPQDWTRLRSEMKTSKITLDEMIELVLTLVKRVTDE